MSIRFGPLVLLLVAVSACSRPTVFHDAADHFSVEAPSGWTEMPFDLVEQLNTTSQGRAQTNYRFICGWQPTAEKREAITVYVCVVGAPVGGRSFADFESEFDRHATCDRSRHRFTSVETMKTKSGVEANAKLTFCVGKESLVMVGCTAPEGVVQDLQPVFDRVIDSLQFDAGYEFHEPSSASGPADSAGK